MTPAKYAALADEQPEDAGPLALREDGTQVGIARPAVRVLSPGRLGGGHD